MHSAGVVDTPCEVWSSLVIMLMVFSRCGPKLQKYLILMVFSRCGPKLQKYRALFICMLSSASQASAGNSLPTNSTPGLANYPRQCAKVCQISCTASASTSQLSQAWCQAITRDISIKYILAGSTPFSY